MSEVRPDFTEEIESNKGAESAPVLESALSTEHAKLRIRQRGCFITDLELKEPGTGKDITVLHSEANLYVPKLQASHVMSPVGPSEGPGGQHGFPRWADYKEFRLNDGPQGQKQIALQAKRSDNGLDITKRFELTDSGLYSHTAIYNPGEEPENTSMGEHYYFRLTGEKSNGLRINGQSLDEILGEGTEDGVMSGGDYFWSDFGGSAVIEFPAGHKVLLKAQTTGGQLGMLFWHRVGSESICFEPTVGFDPETGNQGLELTQYAGATLSTSLELL